MDRLEKLFGKLGLEWTDEKRRQFEAYMEGVLRWNGSVNLTAITDRDEFITKHFMDSLAIADSEEMEDAGSVIDIGTGGGFPGVPLAIAFPGKKFLLVDSLAKRMKIVDELCREAGIGNVRTLHGRAEDLAGRRDLRESFDLCVSRAVANMSTLSEYCLPFVKVGGTFIAYKGPSCEEELEAAQEAIEILGGEMYGVYLSDAVSETSDHLLVYTEKIKKTPSKYPRKAGTPSKQPL